MDFEDLENEIPVHNLRINANETELSVKVVRKNSDGSIETKIDRLKLQSEEQEKRVGIARPFNRFKPISNTISLSIVDVKRARQQTSPENCWQVHDSLFRRILVYGKIVVLNQYSRDSKICYKFSVDDGSESIIGTMNVTKAAANAVSNQVARLTVERNKLKEVRNIGINISGNFHPPESQDCQTIIQNIACLQNVMIKNVRLQRKSYQLGPIKEKALAHCSLYLNNQKEVQLYIIDMSLNDSIELAWKRQLNKLYHKEYLKQPKV